MEPAYYCIQGLYNVSHLFMNSVFLADRLFYIPVFVLFTLFLSVRERAVSMIIRNCLKNTCNLCQSCYPFAQHLCIKRTPHESARRKFHLFHVWIFIKLHNFVFTALSLTERSSLSHNIYLSFSSPISRNRPSEMPLHPILIGRRLFAISFGELRLPIHLFPREIAK